ncbi:Type I phosphodiesterase / nucleotide pyrophosphatase [Salegentibacter echinorum]|uniref:Type I phosphodiesterase / nucleotide pyrophosphatase n=1 Tax=Salegentibacter echinorum TaxID=1073325 RepID=A0A1M5FPV0_SALEC|nr:alkaline phosphatase [Salegentibacter echinorum]SHF93570.1 Type I phosphodiesterase / nucleotide pyrophosphatase [Salegentibacter echinorum]
MVFRSKIVLVILAGLITMVNMACVNKEKAIKSREPLIKHVILVGADGLGSYAFDKAEIPNLRKMMKEGAYSLKTRAVLPSSSAVNWASMIMGSGPELHGFTEWGSKKPELPSAVLGPSGLYPTIFSVIDQQMPKAKMGVSYSWSGIKYLFENELVDLNYNGETEEKTMQNGIDFIVREKPAFTFIHLDEPDHTGHSIGHDTPEYYKAVGRVDKLVGDLLEALEKENLMDNTIIIFTADHGGINKGHGGKTLLETQIPWIAYGKGISGKGKLKNTIVTYDTAATIAHLLGLNIPDFWRGKPVTEILNHN